MFGARIQCVSTRYGRMYIPAEDTVIGRSLRLYGEWAEHEIAMVSLLLRDGPAIIDVGANVGTHALAFAARFPSSPVLAFEPQPMPYALMAGSALLNGYENIRPYNQGCSERSRIVGISVDYEKFGWNTGAVPLSEVRSVQGTPTLLTPLDRALPRENIQFIKIDVEGAEYSVLEGAIGIISNQRPIIYFEVLSLENLRQPRDLLINFGYSLYWMETSAFNADNFNGHPENVWGRGEVGILAMPPATGPQLRLQPVSGSEVEMPSQRSPNEGYRTGAELEMVQSSGTANSRSHDGPENPPA